MWGECGGEDCWEGEGEGLMGRYRGMESVVMWRLFRRVGFAAEAMSVHTTCSTNRGQLPLSAMVGLGVATMQFRYPLFTQ